MTALSETGVNATYQGQSLGTSWFLPAEHLVNINGQDVRIFAYDSVQALEEDADKVSLDGGTIGLVSRWMAPPRFYARGAFLALYVLGGALAQYPGHVKSRDQLMDAAYGESIYVDDRTIDSHVKRMRKKFRVVDPEFDAIEPLYGVGYRYRES